MRRCFAESSGASMSAPSTRRRGGAGPEACNGWTFWHTEKAGALDPIDSLSEPSFASRWRASDAEPRSVCHPGRAKRRAGTHKRRRMELAATTPRKTQKMPLRMCRSSHGDTAWLVRSIGLIEAPSQSRSSYRMFVCSVGKLESHLWRRNQGPIRASGCCRQSGHCYAA